jgi:hypothetical protein
MKRFTLPLVVLVVVVIGVVWMVRKGPSQNAGVSVSQGQTAGGAGGQGGGGPMSQFREAHKITFMLSRMAMNIGRLDTDTDAHLTPAQAKSILAVLTPLRSKTSLTEDDSKAAIMKLKAELTEKQLTEMGKMKQPPRRFGGGGQNGPGGQMGQGGQRPRFDPNAMKEFNPFNPKKGNPMAARSAKRLNALFAALEAKANAK